MNNNLKLNFNYSNKAGNNLLIHQHLKQFDIFKKEMRFKYITTSRDKVLNRFAI